MIMTVKSSPRVIRRVHQIVAVAEVVTFGTCATLAACAAFVIGALVCNGGKL